MRSMKGKHLARKRYRKTLPGSKLVGIAPELPRPSLLDVCKSLGIRVWLLVKEIDVERFTPREK